MPVDDEHIAKLTELVFDVGVMFGIALTRLKNFEMMSVDEIDARGVIIRDKFVIAMTKSVQSLKQK